MPNNRKSKQNDDKRTVSEKLGLGIGTRSVKLGPSFSDEGPKFHTIRYDFKPASVDESKPASVTIGPNNEALITVSHLDGAATPQTVFKGSRKPAKKECILIIDKNTGELVLEKLESNITVKRTREEARPRRPFIQPVARRDLIGNSHSAIDESSNSDKCMKKPFPATKLVPSLSGCIPKHSPLHASPSYPSKSPIHSQHKALSQNKSPIPYKSPSQSSTASLPVLGFDPIASEIREDDTMGCARDPQSLKMSSTRPHTSRDLHKQVIKKEKKRAKKDVKQPSVHETTEKLQDQAEELHDQTKKSKHKMVDSNKPCAASTSKKENLNRHAKKSESLPEISKELKEETEERHINRKTKSKKKPAQSVEQPKASSKVKNSDASKKSKSSDHASINKKIPSGSTSANKALTLSDSSSDSSSSMDEKDLQKKNIKSVKHNESYRFSFSSDNLSSSMEIKKDSAKNSKNHNPQKVGKEARRSAHKVFGSDTSVKAKAEVLSGKGKKKEVNVSQSKVSRLSESSSDFSNENVSLESDEDSDFNVENCADSENVIEHVSDTSDINSCGTPSTPGVGLSFSLANNADNLPSLSAQILEDDLRLSDSDSC